MDDPRRSADEDLERARQALDRGEMHHAADHLAGAIAHAPTLPEAHELLSRLAAHADGGLELFPLEQHAFVGTVVARAHLLAAAGRPEDGLPLLAAATGHTPGVDWAGVPWVSDPSLGTRLEPGGLARIVMQLCTAVGDPAPEPDRAALWPYLTVVRHAVAAHPAHPLLLGAGSALARRLGEPALAVEWAARGTRAEPSKLGEIWLGYAYRSAGRIAESVAALCRAVEHDPDDLSVYADIAGTLADDDRLDEALEWIDRALARDPAFDCAVHTAHRLRYRSDGDLAHLVALADFQRDHPDDSHEHTDLAQCCADVHWLSRVPNAAEAVVDVLRQILATERPSSEATLQVSALEAPSALRAVTSALPGVELRIDQVPAPDLRQVRRADGRMLWQYDGTVATPALAPPSAAAAERLRRIAHPVWAHPPAAYDAAVGLALVEADDLLALLVHPPETPDTEVGRALAKHDPALWVRCAQVWACLGLLHHRTDEPWPQSTRRRLLVELIWGVEDWITEAALFALVTNAWVEPTVRADVARLVGERLADIARVGRQRPVTIAWSVAQLALATPELDAGSQRLATAISWAEENLPAATSPRPGRTTRRRGRLRRWLTGG
ncbi:MAG TPA: tetratricopeptide repeat protein [Actinoplanes sp.]|jgi:tetratricopeptide (TPR) repeat protein